MSTTGESGTAKDEAGVVGELTTRLNTAVAEARKALDGHAGILPDGTLAALDEVLAELARRRVRIALYGEVKAGKSTLINAIAGTVLSPAAFEPLTSIPVRVTYGPTTAWRIAGRRLASVTELEGIMRGNPSGVHEVLVETNLNLLQLGGQVDLLDTPGVGSVVDFDAVSAEALRSLDAVVMVVRYPALFTQFTRRLMEGLETDIGKLFVVWNLDTACGELSGEERTRHAETLRSNVAGANDLALVDARAALRAAQEGDAAARAASGITAFTETLARFVSSSARDRAALREAAKRAREVLAEAHQALAGRQALLDRKLADARGRLRAVETGADTDAATERGRLTALEAALARIGQEAGATSGRVAGELRRRLQEARAGWVGSGDLHALQAAVAAAVRSYADAADAAGRATADSIEKELTTFGAAHEVTRRPRAEPAFFALSDEARQQRATTGRVQWLRRRLWQGWYLPGLAALERGGVDADLLSQSRWVEGEMAAVRKIAEETLGGRLAEIAERAASRKNQIRVETAFAANEAEFDLLRKHVPAVATQLESVSQIAAEARPSA